MYILKKAPKQTYNLISDIHDFRIIL
jgi:hypothetical protein